MDNINLPPFYIGQRVVALDDSCPGFGYQYKKGDEKQVDKLRFSEKSKKWDFLPVGESRYHLACHKFAPIQENFQSISLEKVLELETPLISVN